ncbi:MAG TPA: 6-phosphogluconolactonase [Thermoanaerobaculia bacterium]
MKELPAQAPPRFEIRVLPDLEEAARAAALEVAAAASDAFSDRGIFRLALSGGSTPRVLFDALAGPPFSRRIDWRKARVFFADERCVPPSNERSNYRLAKEHLLDPLYVPARNVFRMRGEEEPRRAARDYDRILRTEFGQGQPRLDLVLLGLGADGHTASLFARTRALEEKEKWAAANYLPVQKEWRLTLTLRVLNAARHVIFLVAGEEKGTAVAAVLARKRGSRSLPASLVRPKSGSLIWILDDAAASSL